MPDDEIDLLQIQRGSISAPAGCGKTHLVCEAIRRHEDRRPILVLTHTNAGVAALRGRLNGAGVAARKYRAATIDGWAMRLVATFPVRSALDPNTLLLRTPNQDYPRIRDAVLALLRAGHLDDILASTYARVVVDEYQDCLTVQHHVIKELARVLPAVVLGDPLQAIFGFGGTLVDWVGDVHANFPEAGELATPHRWINAGHQGLGRWLLEMRAALLAGDSVDLTRAHEDVTWVKLTGKEDHPRRLKAGMTKAPGADGKVLVIVPSLDRGGHIRRQFASQLPGAVVAEAVDMTDLVSFGATFQLNHSTALTNLAGFAQTVMTNVAAADDFVARVDTIRGGKHRNAPNDAELAAMEFLDAPSYPRAANLLGQISAAGGVRIHRPAILNGCYAMLRACEGGSTPHEAAVLVRERSRLIGRPLAKRTVGSTLLLKGLEAEVSVILNTEGMDAANFYVAATRGSTALVICSSTKSLP